MEKLFLGKFTRVFYKLITLTILTICFSNVHAFSEVDTLRVFCLRKEMKIAIIEDSIPLKDNSLIIVSHILSSNDFSMHKSTNKYTITINKSFIIRNVSYSAETKDKYFRLNISYGGGNNIYRVSFKITKRKEFLVLRKINIVHFLTEEGKISRECIRENKTIDSIDFENYIPSISL